MVLCEFHRQIANPLTDAGVIHLAPLLTAFIGKRQRKTVHTECPHHIRKIIVIKFFENQDIMEHCLVNGAFHLSPNLTCHAVTVFIVYQ